MNDGARAPCILHMIRDEMMREAISFVLHCCAIGSAWRNETYWQWKHNHHGKKRNSTCYLSPW